MLDYIIVPRRPDPETIRRAGRNLLHREPTDAEYARLVQVYQDMTTGIPDSGLTIAYPASAKAIMDPDALLHQASE